MEATDATVIMNIHEAAILSRKARKWLIKKALKETYLPELRYKESLYYRNWYGKKVKQFQTDEILFELNNYASVDYKIKTYSPIHIYHNRKCLHLIRDIIDISKSDSSIKEITLNSKFARFLITFKDE